MNKFTPKPTLLPIAFFDRDTETVARELLGKILVRRLITESETGKKEVFLTGRIVETEAYVGPDDLASHASRGKTPRNAPMFGPPGHWYVYLIYGMHHCVNIVTGAEGFPAAVLLRSVIPMEGIPLMQRLRAKKNTLPENSSQPTKGGSPQIPHLANGPGKLCRAFAIDRTLNDTDATAENATLFLADDGFDTPATSILALPRVGVGSAQEWKDRPLRFLIKTL